MIKDNTHRISILTVPCSNELRKTEVYMWRGGFLSFIHTKNEDTVSIQYCNYKNADDLGMEFIIQESSHTEVKYSIHNSAGKGLESNLLKVNKPDARKIWHHFVDLGWKKE